VIGGGPYELVWAPPYCRALSLLPEKKGVGQEVEDDEEFNND
jgi:hypothetical protein